MRGVLGDCLPPISVGEQEPDSGLQNYFLSWVRAVSLLSYKTNELGVATPVPGNFMVKCVWQALLKVLQDGD